MVRRCSVPKCWTMADNVYTCKDISKRNSLHSLPFTFPDRWREWLIKCPFYKKFSRIKLENIKICNHHFIPQHIFEKDGKRRLTKDAVPLLKLPDYYNGNTSITEVVTKDTKALEICPVQGNKPVNFKIVDYDPVVVSKTEETFKSQSAACTGNRFCDEDILSEVRIKPQGNIPVDHNMYTFHKQTEGTMESLSIESDQCALKQSAVNVDILEEKSVKEEIIELSDEETLGTSLDWMLDETSQIDADTPQNHSTVCSDKHSEALDEDRIKKEDMPLDAFSNESLQISSQNIAMESQDQNCIFLCGNVTPDPVQEEIIDFESDTQTLENSEGIHGVQESLVINPEGLSEVHIGSEGNCNLPIDHNMYTLSPRTPDISKCSIEGDQRVNKPSQECTLKRKLQDEIIDLSNEETLSPPADCMSSQIFTDMSQYQFIECYDQLSDYVSASFAQPLRSKLLESEIIDPKLEDQVASLFINEAICNLLTNAVADASSQTDSDPAYPLLINCHEQTWNSLFANVAQNPWEPNLPDNNLLSNSVSNADSQNINNKQPQIIVTPNIFQLSTESAFVPQTVKSLHELSDEKALKENNNQPMCCNLRTKDKCKCENSSTGVKNLSSDLNKIHSLVAKKSSPKKQTLESLVAQLLDSVESEPKKTCTESHLQPSGVVVQSHLSANMICKKKSQTCFKSSSRRIPILSKRVRINKDGSTPNERALREQNNILKAKLKNLNDKYVRLKSRTQHVYAEAKQFLKNYSFLSDKGKFLVDFQLRLAKGHPKGARYNDEEKKFAVNLYRISREGYRFLQQYLKLPTRTTISNADSSMQPEPTINENFFEYNI